MRLPRGIRCHNPGNIEFVPGNTPFQGQVGAEPDPDGEGPLKSRFILFKAPEWGIRALMRILITYQRLYGCRTIAAMIHRWAPPSENNTTSYINAVSRHVGVGPEVPLDLRKNPYHLRLMAEAIVRHECDDPTKWGVVHPYWYPEETYVRALGLLTL